MNVRDTFNLLPEIFLDTRINKVKTSPDIEVIPHVALCEYLPDFDLNGDSRILAMQTDAWRDKWIDNKSGKMIYGGIKKMFDNRHTSLLLSAEVITDHIPIPAIHYPMWATNTAKINQGKTFDVFNDRRFLADVLLGGYTEYRADIFNALKDVGLINKCLVMINDRSDGRGGVNYRTPALSQLDDPAFITTSLVDGKMFTMLGNAGHMPGQINYLSQNISPKIYENSYISLVAETEHNNKNKYLMSEKTFKPMVGKRPFVVYADPGHLAALKDLGFRTFDKWIDEDYDQIHDDSRRIKALVGSILEFNKTDKDSTIRDMREVLEHNHNLCYNYKHWITPVVNRIFA